ncbi:TIGR00296 family protein [Haloterrigena sp. SYSU A558-1]|uniref:TIGR00296 family protein n=1 Tax=Haloterrigena gelatinilytica TaxID=2741724 RepID=A0A8J8GJU0_9EURY|nr:TIGR00296 family protein [Haloterrigena gelatinilytica]NUB90540.1 TIGR00296 family protein [Haloterrigena gelatinilytica]NUC73649.1 TIGR00296 family protein [Haloterrigena gelatinilytica]
MSQRQGVDLSYEDGARAVELAREAVESFVQHGQREQPGSMREAFYERTGAFVRLESTRGRGSLRGCAGGYRSGEQLGHVIVDSAIEAASEDSCGSEVTPSELPNLTVSVCAVRNVVLTDDPLADLELGTHGVAIDGGGEGGWLYPTVPVQNNWSAREYLDRTCRKAGLPPTAWQNDDVVVTLFEGQVFREREADGSIEEL